MKNTEWWNSRSVPDLLREVGKRPDDTRKKFLLVAALASIWHSYGQYTGIDTAECEQMAGAEEHPAEEPAISLDELLQLPVPPPPTLAEQIEEINRYNEVPKVHDMLSLLRGNMKTELPPFDVVNWPGAAEATCEARWAVADIFGHVIGCGRGNRPPGIDPSWLTSDVLSLAHGNYDNQFDRMPILADALQDAGCDNADILNHCRGPGPHVRGCWVVDLILGMP